MDLLSVFLLPIYLFICYAHVDMLWCMVRLDCYVRQSTNRGYSSPWLIETDTLVFQPEADWTNMLMIRGYSILMMIGPIVDMPGIPSDVDWAKHECLCTCFFVVVILETR